MRQAGGVKESPIRRLSRAAGSVAVLATIGVACGGEPAETANVPGIPPGGDPRPTISVERTPATSTTVAAPPGTSAGAATSSTAPSPTTTEVTETTAIAPTSTTVPPATTSAPSTAPPTTPPAPTTTALVYSPEPVDGPLRVGVEGPRSLKVQQDLIALGILPATAADSKYGPGTASGVRRFQESRGLVVDGVAGPNTLAALAESIAALTPDTAPATTTA